MADLRDRLKRRLEQVVSLGEREAEQVTSEVFDCFNETIDEFIVARHAELQSEGHKTRSSYARIQSEAEEWRFRAPRLTVRQIRRRIYG